MAAFTPAQKQIFEDRWNDMKGRSFVAYASKPDADNVHASDRERDLATRRGNEEDNV